MNEFEKLCQQNQETVYRYLLALCRDEHLAEELTAETFYRAFLHIDRFRKERLFKGTKEKEQADGA